MRVCFNPTVAGISLLAFIAGAGSSARADWEVKRAPKSSELTTQVRRALLAKPDDKRLLERLIAQRGGKGGLAKLDAEWVAEAARTGGLAEQLVAGHLARANRDLATAITRYQIARGAHPTDPRPLRAIAEVQLELGKLREGYESYRALLALLREPAERAPILRRLADLAGSPEVRRPAEDALAATRGYLEELLARSPSDEVLARELGELLAAGGKQRDALPVFRALAARQSRDPGALAATEKRIGELCEAIGDDKCAVDAFAGALARLPREHSLRRELLARWLEHARKRDELGELATHWEHKWPEAARGFAEWEALARLYDERADVVAAERAYRRAIAKEPHSIDTRKRLIATLDRAGRDADALAEWKVLARAAPGDARIALELIERLRKSGGPGIVEARARATQLARTTRDPGVHARIADLYAEWGLVDEALKERALLVTLEPDEEAHLVELGELYFQRGDKARAIETWRRVTKARGKPETLTTRLADVLDEHGLAAEARPLYLRARELAPSDLAVRRAYATSLERNRRDIEALAEWQQIFEAQLDSASPSSATDARARILALARRRGSSEQLAAHYSSAKPKAATPEAQLEYARLASELWLQADKAAAAATILDEVRARVASRPALVAEAWVARAKLHEARQETERAIAALKQALDLDATRATELLPQIASLSLALYRDADALTFAKKAAELSPKDASAYERLAEIQLRGGSLDDAAAAYERALQLEPHRWKLRLTLARLSLRRGDYPRASALYRELLERTQEEEALTEAAARALDLDELLGSLDKLEQILAPLAFASPDRRIYSELLLDLYERLLPTLARRAAQSPEHREALRKAGARALRPTLDLLVNATPAAERRAIKLLALTAQPAAAAALLKLALTARPTAEYDIREHAAIAASLLADARAFDGLRALAAQPDRLLRAYALVGLSRLDDARTTPLLVEALHSDSDRSRAIAALGLGRQRATRALPDLARMLRDREESLDARAAAAWAMAAMSKSLSPAHVDALIATLSEGGEEPQRAAAHALGGQPRAIAALIKAAFTASAQVRIQAARALCTAPLAPDLLTAMAQALDASRDGLDLAALLRSIAPAVNVSECSPLAAPAAEALLEAVSEALSAHQDLAARALDDLLGDTAAFPLGTRARELLGDRLAAALESLLARPQAHALHARALALRVRLPSGEAFALAFAKKANQIERIALYDALLSAPGKRPIEWAPALTASLASANSGERLRAARLAGRLAARDRALTDQLTARRADTDGFVRDAARAALESM